MAEEPEASALTARRAAQHFRLSSADDACEHLYILTIRSSLGLSPPNAGRYTVASRFRCRSCERGYIFPRAPEQFVASPLCLVGYVRWDARSDRVPPLQTIIFSSFTGRRQVVPNRRAAAAYLLWSLDICDAADESCFSRDKCLSVKQCPLYLLLVALNRWTHKPNALSGSPPLHRSSRLPSRQNCGLNNPLPCRCPFHRARLVASR